MPLSEDLPSQPPLHMACERGMLDVVQALVEQGANVNGKVRMEEEGVGGAWAHLTVT